MYREWCSEIKPTRTVAARQYIRLHLPNENRCLAGRIRYCDSVEQLGTGYLS